MGNSQTTSSLGRTTAATTSGLERGTTTALAATAKVLHPEGVHFKYVGDDTYVRKADPTDPHIHIVFKQLPVWKRMVSPEILFRGSETRAIEFLATLTPPVILTHGCSVSVVTDIIPFFKFRHWAIYDETNDTFIEYRPVSGGGKARVHQVSRHFFMQENQDLDLRIEHIETLFDNETIVSRARSQIGTEGYNLIQWNCESFVRWAAADTPLSGQIRSILNKIPNWVAKVGKWAAFIGVVLLFCKWMGWGMKLRLMLVPFIGCVGPLCYPTCIVAGCLLTLAILGYFSAAQICKFLNQVDPPNLPVPSAP